MQNCRTGKTIMTIVPRSKKSLLIILTTMALTITLLILINKQQFTDLPQLQQTFIVLNNNNNRETRMEKNWRGLNDKEIENLTVLGRYLFLQEDLPKINSNRIYNILVWKYGKIVKNRHVKRYSNKFFDPFEHCSVNNCNITYKNSDMKIADIVIIHLHEMKYAGELPSQTKRKPNQIWAFLTDESPYHTFLSKHNLTDYNGVFNWSMTYRMDSDIPIPYGLALLRKTQNLDNFTIMKRKDVLVAILVSKCSGQNNRWKYVKELQKYITVDIYGGCGTFKTCPGRFRADCHDIDNYLFYLSFENSNCEEYITEKVWWNAFKKNSIPIVMGATKKSCSKLLPPGSYLHIEDYAQPKDLATHLLYLNESGEYKKYYYWKKNFQILNGHGYFQCESFHFCRICEALNFNKKDNKVYEHLENFWSVTRDCHQAA